MIQFKIIAVGKLKEKYLIAGVAEYIKRISGFSKITFVEIGEEKSSDQPNDSEIQKLISAEGNRILEKLTTDLVVVTLEIQGELFSSEQLASWIDTTSIYKSSKICFVIGGSYGLSDEVKKRSNLSISFSKMTFPHQLMRLILLEQLYRSMTINNNITYHK